MAGTTTVSVDEKVWIQLCIDADQGYLGNNEAERSHENIDTPTGS